MSIDAPRPEPAQSSERESPPPTSPVLVATLPAEAPPSPPPAGRGNGAALPPPLPSPGLAALLSLVVPGLGQIYQGLAGGGGARLAKGFFFLVTLLGMFFYGSQLGAWRNVYLPHQQDYLLEEEQAGRLEHKSGGERPL